jgi:hypothetical protein
MARGGEKRSRKFENSLAELFIRIDVHILVLVLVLVSISVRMRMVLSDSRDSL